MPETIGETRTPIIVGSGAAGAAAALALARLGIRPIMLDVGHADPGAGPKVEGNLYDYRKRHDTFDLFIGEDFQGVADVLKDEVGVAKLNAPNMAFITRDAETPFAGGDDRLRPYSELRVGRVGQRVGFGPVPLHRR